ncbi:MAG TPA: aspartate--tRNA ligase, partial [Thermomicrobiales bacterium]|nr:aspartate--tRNA ligase [Thermomicrobiales bacterium]
MPAIDVRPETADRTTCGGLRLENAGERITLQGWVNRRRDLGGLIFIDLRDRFGITQVVFNPEVAKAAHDIAGDLRNEYVIRVEGLVRDRPEGTVNPKMDTGEIELEAHAVEILNPSKTPPFYINEEVDVDESLRLKYRYLDLRRRGMTENMIQRHRVVKHMRDFLDKRGFLEIETPLLIKSTPEGARDYLVPSSQFPGMFYALPQSPQQMKQLLMVSGLDRYFQIARCFRDEPQRADRQPEFTQLDLEMSFVDQEDVMALNEALFIELTEKFSDMTIQEKPFPRLSYREAMDRFGNDRPDLRFGLELQDVSDALRETEFKAFKGVLDNGGQVKGIVVPGCADYTRKQIDELTELAKQAGAKGLATMQLQAGGLKSPTAKFLTQNEVQAMTTGIGAKEGDLVLFVADQPAVVAKALSALREEFGERLQLADANLLAFCWVVEFPLLEWDEDVDRWDATHNPFSSYYEEDEHLLDTDPGKVRAKQYDLIGNGFELGGGSIRINKRAKQERIFELMGHSKEAQQERFGALLDALEYGAPPHGGCAFGLDRYAMLIAHEDSIREVIAFPKNQRGVDLMFNAPDTVEPEQLDDLGL